MIDRGWIFPDGTEYSCSEGYHLRVVSDFINGLKFQNLELHEKMMKETDDWFFKFGSKNLYLNYAIERLGWIKIGTSVWHDIKYAGFDWQLELIEPYVERGDTPINLYVDSNSYLPIECNILKAIRDG